MNFIEYVKQLWKNGPSGGTPWSAARLNHMEDGIKANNDMISELNSNIGKTSYVSNLLDDCRGKWCEIGIFSCAIWNMSSFIMIGAKSIYSIAYGYDKENLSYINRCNALKIWGLEQKIGFKVINNVLHIYVKQTNHYTSVACFGLEIENTIPQFDYKTTNLADCDMDKIC